VTHSKLERFIFIYFVTRCSDRRDMQVAREISPSARLMLLAADYFTNNDTVLGRCYSTHVCFTFYAPAGTLSSMSSLIYYHWFLFMQTSQLVYLNR